MKKPLYYLDQYEKQRILEMHKTATSNVYLKEEKQPINEIAPLLWLLGIGAATGIGAKLIGDWMNDPSQRSVEAVHKACSDSRMEKEKTLNSNAEHIQIAKEINKALSIVDVNVFKYFSGDSPKGGTDEEAVAKNLEKIKSIPDYCAVAKQYNNLYKVDMLKDIDGDFDLQSDWAEYIHKPLTKAVEYSNKLAKSDTEEIQGWGDQTPERDPGSGGNDTKDDSKDSEDDGISYIACKGEFYKGCMDPIYGSEIKKLQRCLGIEPSGKFNTETEERVKSEFNKTKVNSSDISYICGEL
jgi:hypothetical protein